MSLTRELRNVDSPIRAFLDGLSQPLAATCGNSESTAVAAAQLGFIELVTSDVLVPPPPGGDAPRSGTAFDIRTRMSLGKFEVEGSASALGIDAMNRDVDGINNGDHRVRVMAEVYDVARSLLAASPTEDDLDLASLLLASPEQFYRANTLALSGSLGEALDRATDAQSFIEALVPSAVADIRSLRITNAEQVNVWRDYIAAGEPFEGNPSFVGALLVGGADGDWLAGDTLVDCKVYEKLTVPKLRDFLRQLLGYVMLDLDDALKIRTVGVWLPRQAKMATWSLESLLAGDPEVLLPRLREDFVKSTRNNQMAIHVPVTEQRKLQLVADNRFSPSAMLRTLAYGDDRYLRFRVGRNQATPVDVIRILAEDRYAAVRVGVASNRAVPRDVLATLTKDPSITVRRAAGVNPGAALAQNRALTAESTVSGTGIVMTTTHAALSMDLAPMQINQDRAPEAIDFRLLANILSVMSEGSESIIGGIRLPEASRVFAWRTGRQPVVPEQLRRDLPAHVVESMFDLSRPPYMRGLAAKRLPIDDPEIRVRLLTDSDADIRWDALMRLTDCLDEAMSTFLAGLASSREARLEFRIGGVPRRELWRRPAEYDLEVLVMIARHPAMPLDSLHVLLDQKSADVLLAVAGSPSLDDDGFDLLVERMLLVKSTQSRQRFADSSACPSAVLERLAQNRSVDLRLAVAQNRNTPEATLELLSQSKELDVRMGVLENSSTPAALATSIAEQLLTTLEDIGLLDALCVSGWRNDLQLPDGLVEEALDRLSKSRVRDPDPREYVAGDSRTSAQTLTRLAKSADASVRLAVAENSRTSPETLSALLLDASLDVRVEAARGIEEIEEPDDESEIQSAELEVATGPRPKLAVAELHEMAASKRADVRKQAAYSSAATPDILTFLAGDRRSVIVRRIIAANPHTPTETLRALATEGDAEISQALAFSGTTPVDVLVELAGRSVDLALLVAFNPDAPEGILGALADDDDPLVQFVAQEVLFARPALTSGDEEGQLTHVLLAPEAG